MADERPKGTPELEEFRGAWMAFVAKYEEEHPEAKEIAKVLLVHDFSNGIGGWTADRCDHVVTSMLHKGLHQIADRQREGRSVSCPDHGGGVSIKGYGSSN